MQEHIEDLRRRVAEAEALGGKASEERQHKQGKLTARERLGLLLDPGSFAEFHLFAESRSSDFGMDKRRAPGDGVVTGSGRIGGQLVFAAAQDFGTLGGSLGETHAQKIVHAIDLAMKAGCPFIQILDSGGARIQEGVRALDGYARIFERNTLASGVIPQISVILGPCAGGAVYSPAITDFVFMVEGLSKMFITGPDVIKAVTGEEVSFEDLGGAHVHSALSGNAHFVARDERECFELIRKLIAFLPANNLDDPPLAPLPDWPPAENPELEKVVPAEEKRAYDVRDVIRNVFDAGDFMEVQERYARNIVVGFARLEGRPIGVVGNQPSHLAGVLDIDSSDKLARFVRFCDAFNLPLVNFVDVPGYLPGTRQEHGGVIRHGAKVLFAYSEATVPKVAVILRKSYGGAYIAMSGFGLGYDRVIAYPAAEIAVMGPDGAANIIFRREIGEAADPEAVRRQKIEEYRRLFAKPYTAAGQALVDTIIEPRFTRRELLRALEMTSRKRQQRPDKKHGNIPL
ncbi:MAG: methylmalonyl-CoA carboxyltransferase [Candidatus Tectomicrobia bacterium]|nr:methylmalonyl-CoA carboxyltransferase [Candidatus Tectomicrobia bacterium]